MITEVIVQPPKIDTTTDPQVGFRPPGTLDASTALQPYDGRFGTRHAAHLLRRAGFGGSDADVAHLASLGMGGAVDSLLHPTTPDVDFPAYPPSDKLYDIKVSHPVAQYWWLDRMLRTQHPLVEKMTLFWHNHFATSINKVPAQYMCGMINLFRDQGLGRFPVLLSSVTRDPAMLIWLDNRYNAKAHPNENYAREVMELFALGLGNYTEDDIKEAARAFTGWSIDAHQQAVFIPARHDDGQKTVLGHTGPLNADDVIAIIVSQPVHQRFLAHKLLEFFVYSDPEDELIESVAQVYALSGFDVAKTVGTILRSNVFYSTRAYRAIPKSPIELVIGTLRYLGAQTVPAYTTYKLAQMGQEPMNPPSVKGWDGGPTWINTTTLLARFNFINGLIAQTAPGKNGQAAVPAPNVSPDDMVQRYGMDPAKVAAAIVSGIVQDDVTSDVRGTLVAYLNSQTPSTSVQNPVPFGPENYQDKIRGALALALNLPVNQLD
ncbi:MAG: DUF1800 domain-containing protein [Candidatus Eremiobacteraeota bacterium]|nr:DUF1800 domain-containing protein [Candidatus Eremiobacteraeota bacterium]MBV9407191.1 DUF1800 domain-containing protein [Candidatus Eremiobacteraeota bacterium]